MTVCIGVVVNERGKYVTLLGWKFSSREEIEEYVKSRKEKDPEWRNYTPLIFCFDLKKHGRYLVFAGDTEPEGGWDDFVGATDDLEEARRYCKTYTLIDVDGWAEIVDAQTREIIETYTGDWEKWDETEAFLKSQYEALLGSQYRAKSTFQSERGKHSRYGQSQTPICPVCGRPMREIIEGLYQCPDHPFQTFSKPEV